MPRREEEISSNWDEEEKEPWIELIDRIDSTGFSGLFRNMVLVAGLLHLRDSSLSALKDLETIIQETENFSKRIASAKEKHPEVSILKSIERDLREFSFRTDGFHNGLLASELRGGLELLSLCLLLSRSPTPESKTRKANLAKRITKLARHIKLRDENLEKIELPTSIASPTKEERKREEDEEESDPSRET